MSGPIVRTGTTPEFWKNWDNVFGDKKKKTTSKKTSKKATVPKASKKSTKKKAKKSGKK